MEGQAEPGQSTAATSPPPGPHPGGGEGGGAKPHGSSGQRRTISASHQEEQAWGGLVSSGLAPSLQQAPILHATGVLEGTRDVWVGKGQWELGAAGCPAPLPVPHRATRPPHQAHFYLFLPKRSKNPQQDLGCAQPEVPEVPEVPAAPRWEAWSEASGGATELLPARSGKLLHPHTETCHHKSRVS